MGRDGRSGEVQPQTYDHAVVLRRVWALVTDTPTMSYRELGAALGGASTSTIGRALRHLRDHFGVITFEDKSPRARRVLVRYDRQGFE